MFEAFLNTAASRALDQMSPLVKETAHNAGAAVVSVTSYEPDGITADHWGDVCGGISCVDKRQLTDILSKLVLSDIKAGFNKGQPDKDTIALLWAEAEDARQPLAKNFLDLFPKPRRGDSTLGMSEQTSLGLVVVHGVLSLDLSLEVALSQPHFQEAASQFKQRILRPLPRLIAQAARLS